MSLYNWSLLILISMIFGSSYFFIEIALQGIPPFILVFLRTFIAAIIFFILVKILKLQIPKDKKTWSLYLIMGILNNAIPFTLITLGEVHVKSALTSVLMSTLPIFTMLAAHFFTSDEKMNRHKVLGAIIGFLGVYTIIYPGLEGGISAQVYGEIGILLAALSYAFANICGRKLSQHSPIINSACMLLCASIILLPITLIFETHINIVLNTKIVLAISALTIIGTVGGFALYFRLLSTIGATRLSLATFLIPITTILLGIIFLDEHLDSSSTLGMTIIVIGLNIADGRFAMIYKKYRPYFTKTS